MRRSAAAYLAAVLLALVGSAPGAGAQTAPAPVAAVASPVDGSTVLVLLRSTLLALDHANKTGNYSVLRELGAAGFQSANSSGRLSQIFASHRDRQLDLAAAAILEPRLRQLPQLTTDGMLHLAGFIPAGALQVDFELLYSSEGGKWRLFGLSVDLSTAQAAAAAPPVADETPSQPAGAAANTRGSRLPPAPKPRPSSGD